MQLELNQKAMAELDSRLQKHLTEWEIEKETMLSAAASARDQCSEKDLALTSVHASHSILQSQLYDACSRETKLSHELEEVLEFKEKVQSENEELRSTAEEMFLVLRQQGQEISRQETVFELKLQKADDKVEDTHRQMNAILVDLNGLVLTKEKLEVDIESIEKESLHHCLSIEQQLAKAYEDKNQLEDLSAYRENEFLGELNTLKSENVSFSEHIQALEVGLEDAKVLIKQKEEEMAVVRRNWTDLESKVVQTQEKLRASTSLAKELARSEEQWKLQKQALAAENKRLTRCMACREIEFSSLQGQKEDLENNLKEAHEKERATNMALFNLKEDLKILEKQWQVEREQLKDKLVAVNRELVENQELKHAFNMALNELQVELKATEKNCEVTISALETHWNTAREEMSSHISELSQDFDEVKRCAEITQLDLAKAQSLVSAADVAIEQLLEKSLVLNESNIQLLEEQEALRLDLSHWEQYAVELHKSSCPPSPLNDDKAVAAADGRTFNYYFDLLQGEVERTRFECEKLRAEVLDKDSIILSAQMELSCTLASSRQVEIELECVADERSHLKLQLDNINRALANAQDEVRCREVQLEQFEDELYKVVEILGKTEEKMDESAREWRKQIEGVEAEMEAAKLYAIEKGSEVTMLRRQFEQGQTTLQETELLINALVRANDSAKLDVLKWKSREENMALQIGVMLTMIEEEVSLTIDQVDNQMQALGSDIHGMRTLLADSCSEIVAGFDLDFKEFVVVQISEIERAAGETNIKLSKMYAKVTESEQRLYKTVMENEILQITLTNAEELLRVSEAALADAMQNFEAQHKGWATARDELQGALASMAEKDACISESALECDRLSTRVMELDMLFTESLEELKINAARLKEMEIEKLTLVEATHILQGANIHLRSHVQQLQMSVADGGITKQVMEMEIARLRQLKDSSEDEIHKLEADLDASRDAVKAAAAKLLETETTIQALNTDLEDSHSEIICVQRSLDTAVTEINDLRQHVHDLEEKEVHLLAQTETQRLVLEKNSDKLVQVEADSDAAMEILETMLDSTSSELYVKETVIANLEASHSKFSSVLAALKVFVCQLEQEKEFLLEKASALDNEKKDLLKMSEMRSKQLCKQAQEASAASAAHLFQLDILRTIIESASSELQEKDHMITALREKVEESSAYAQKMLNSLELADLASAQIEYERDGLLETANNLETEKRVFLEELEMKSRECAEMEVQVLRLQTEVQDVSTESCKQNLELEILSTMLESAIKESSEKDAMASDLENLLSQSQLQNAEMLQSSQEVVNHFSLFQSQLDACFQQNRELERSKLVLTTEVHSFSQEIAELKEQRQASEKSFVEMTASFAQLKLQKDEELRVRSDEFEKLKSLEAVMEADLWDWEQRCQDTEAQLDEKNSELEMLRGKLLSTQEECKERVELMYDELQGCQLRIAEMDSERRDLINEIEEGSAIIAEFQEKLQTRENDMEEHFSRHSVDQEVLDSLENEKRALQSSVKHLTSEVASYQQRATAAKDMEVETRLEMEALVRDLKQKDDLLQSLESDLNLLQESALQELRLNQDLESLRATTDALQQELNLHRERRTRLEVEFGQVTEEIIQIRNQAAMWKGKAYELETELDKKRQTIESLEDELRMAEQNMVNTLEEATIDLKDVENDRDRLQAEVLEFSEQLEMTEAMLEERDAVASELHQVD